MISVAWITWREILRDRLFYVSVFLALVLIGVSLLAANLTIGRPERVVLNFGLAGFSLATLLIGIVFGAGLIHGEIERRTALVTMSKPISAGQFLIGKWLGLAATLVVNGLILGTVFLVILNLVGGKTHPTVVYQTALFLLQSLFASAIAVFFSVFSGRTFAIVATLGTYMIGTNISQLEKMAESAPFLKVYTWILPNFENFNLGWLATYQLPVNLGTLGLAWAYALVFGSVVLVLACVGFHRRGI
jgi:ABC-type transport system involved in multi-copper enzyme maturation permease subunit